MNEYEHDFSTAEPWTPNVTVLMWVSFALILIFLLIVFRSVLPFALGAIVIAYLLNPLTNLLDRFVPGGRAPAASATVLFLWTLLLVAIFTIIPALTQQTINVLEGGVEQLDRLLTDPQEWFFNGEPVFADPETGEALTALQAAENAATEAGFADLGELLVARSGEFLNPANIQQVLRSAGGVTSTIFGSALGVVGSTFGFALNTLLSTVILFSFLSGGPQMFAGIVAAAPDDYQSDLKRLLEDLGAVWNDYVRGNLILGGIVGSAMYVFATIMGLPNPLFLAVFAGLMEFIPNIGPVMSWGAVVLFGLFGGAGNFPEMANYIVGIIAGVYGLIVLQLEGLFLVPRILGDSLSLHPVLVILSVLWGASVGGILGVLIAPPLVASVRIVLHYIYGRLTGRTAFHHRGRTGRGSSGNALQRLGALWSRLLETGDRLANPPKKRSS